jgi:hypothetical protein
MKINNTWGFINEDFKHVRSDNGGFDLLNLALKFKTEKELIFKIICNFNIISTSDEFRIYTLKKDSYSKELILSELIVLAFEKYNILNNKITNLTCCLKKDNRFGAVSLSINDSTKNYLIVRNLILKDIQLICTLQKPIIKSEKHLVSFFKLIYDNIFKSFEVLKSA